MVTILGFPVELPPELAFLASPWTSFVLTSMAWVLIALLVNLIFFTLFKTMFRQLPGEVEDIVLGILRRPVLLLISVVGAANSLRILELGDLARWIIQRMVYTILVLVLLHLFSRLVGDLLKFFGVKWASKTESRMDDVLVPVLNIFGLPFFVIAAALIILPLWGINVTSVLLGAGVVGLVLGLALQETLSNIFGGLSLLVEAPFKTGDLVVLPDGKMVEVQQMGLRSTQFYWLEEHSTVFVPNKILSTSMLVNITRPTVEQRVSVDVNVSLASNLAHVEETLRRIAVAHPAVVVADLSQKIPQLRERILTTRARARVMSADLLACKMLQDEADRYELAIPRLELEDNLNRQLLAMEESFRSLIRGILAREEKGLSSEEITEIFCRYVSPADEEVEKTIAAANAWCEARDPWLNDKDYWNIRKLWVERNKQLEARWEKLKRIIRHPHENMEFLLDEMTKAMLDWLESDYKILPVTWKDPQVSFLNFDGSSANLRLSFYVDNTRLEHDRRIHRVRKEVARQVREQLSEEDIW
ncbi:MAG: mechanosensitive ion channel family protein [Anaerolineaceae bacterium]|nr:mechanosensitive ion channel family protein [Anaerolineaceae bacterium]